MTPATIIQNYLLLHLSKEIQGLDCWRANRYKGPGVRAGGRMGMVDAGIDGQADLTGHYGIPARGITNRRIEIEVKAPGDSQNQAQRDFERRCVAHGTLYILCRVRRKESIAEILSARSGSPHPAEIAAFFAELRGRL